jgi:hypothetical protein
MNKKILILATVVLVTLIATASILVAFTATAQTPSATSPVVDSAYITQALNTTLVVTNNQTGITTIILLRLAPNITEPNGILVNNFSLMNTVIEFKVVPDANSNATGGNQTVQVLGALSLLENEVDPVIDKARSYNWSILTKQELPTLQMLYWQTEGKLSTIITNLQDILKMTSLNVTTPLVSQTALNTTQIAEMLGGVPINSAVAGVVVSRNDTVFASLSYPSVELNDFSLMSCVFQFAPYPMSDTFNPIVTNMTNQTVGIVGTFVLLDSEVDAVTRTLLNSTVSMQNNVTALSVPMARLTCISGFMVHPKIMLVSFEMVGDLNQSISILNDVINQTTIRGAEEQEPQLHVCKDVMNYIKMNHNETAPYISANMNWTGGRIDTGLLGSERYVFTSGLWTVSMQYPVVPDPIYTVNATYNSTQVMIDWQGTWQNETIKETNYAFTPMTLSEQEQVRNDCMAYIKANHNQTAPYISSDIHWVGGWVNTSLDGSGTYSWVGDGWNVTEQYPVVPNPIYTVNATYTSTQAQIMWQGTWANGTITETNFVFTPMEVSEQEQVRDACINYIKTNHSQTAPYIPATMTWTGGNLNVSLVGSATYMYTSGNWNLTLQYPIVPNPIYTVNATYTSEAASIIWAGTWQNGTITETSFVFNATMSPQEMVRDDVMNYIMDMHNQTAPYISPTMLWSGGRLNTSLIGSETYVYTSGNWNLTLQYPVVLDPIYTVNATYNSSQVMIVWQGTWQNGSIHETNFTFDLNTNPTAQARDDVMTYIKTTHNQTAPYIQSNTVWSGGRLNTSLLGSETYQYNSGNWNVSVQYPVVLDPIYTVNATYTSTQATITWQGTWHNGTVTETAFTFNATTPSPSPTPSPSVSPSPSPSMSPTPSTTPTPTVLNIHIYVGDNGFSLTSTNLTSPGPTISFKANYLVNVTVTNVGTTGHAWALTTAPTLQGTVLYAIGSAANPIMPNQSISLAFTLLQTGNFSYISPVSGDLGRGLWGNATVTP